MPVGATHEGPRVTGISPDFAAGPLDRAPVFRIELDRRIAAASIPQGVVEITSGENYVFVDLEIRVVHPALVVRPSDLLDPDVDYSLALHPLRDLEGHASAEVAARVFHTGSTTTPPTPDAVTYDDVAGIFAGCAVAGCHVGSGAPLGLDLSSARAIRATAIGIAAREVAPAVGGYLDATVTASFIGLPRIDPRNPARSYLLYTMLGDVHIAGAPMPPSGELASDAELELLERWIQAGVPGV